MRHPIADSTTRSLRTLPDWERPTQRTRTFRRAVGVRFYRELSIHPDTRRSRRFGLICLALASILNSVTLLAHYGATAVLSAAPRWLPPIGVVAIAAPVLIFATSWGLLELIAYLTSAEGRYWGLRMPRGSVRRVLHYLAVHLVLASAVVMVVPVTYFVLMKLDPAYGLYMVEYLYGLSGMVVLAALYLFKIYWAAMKAIMFASRVTTDAPARPAGAL